MIQKEFQMREGNSNQQPSYQKISPKKGQSITQNTMLRVAVTTWNLHGVIPADRDLISLFKTKTFLDEPQIIFFLTQQCQRSILMSVFCENKDYWENVIQGMLEKSYVMVETQTMVGLHLAAFVRKDLVKYTQVIEKDKLRSGYFGIFGNKGAIKIVLSVYGQIIEAVNCHLPPGQNGNENRNQVLLRIYENFIGRGKSTEVFLGGDLNYRIQMSQQEYRRMIDNKPNTEGSQHYCNMIDRDQLRNQAALQKKFFSNFQELPITFPPTYRLTAQNQAYTPQRIPGWTDRIFHRSSQLTKQISYICEYNVLGSDHRPVIGLYELNIMSPSFKEYDRVKEDQGCQIM